MNFTAARARILAVDDQEINLMVLERLLTPTEAGIVTATGGQEMLDLLKKEKFDLILLDHVMPPPDGLEAFRMARSMEGNLNLDTPFVALTGNDMRSEGADPSLPPREATRAYYKGEGFADYLPKPVLPEDMERVLLDLLPADKVTRTGQSAPAGNPAPESAPAPRKGGLFARIQEMEGKGNAAAPAGPLDSAHGLTFSGGDKEMYRQLFKNWADAYMENGYTLQRSAKEGDLNAHRIAAHSLKSSSRMVGAMTLGDLSEKAEHAARDGDLEYVREHVPELLEAYGKAVEAASDYLAN
ncbi:MAG: response regulator [Treponema sp.]|nr:response regulator [Treponema sp.]